MFLKKYCFPIPQTPVVRKKVPLRKKNSFKSLEMLARSCWECTYARRSNQSARLQGIAEKTRKTTPRTAINPKTSLGCFKAIFPAELKHSTVKFVDIWFL